MSDLRNGTLRRRTQELANDRQDKAPKLQMNLSARLARLLALLCNLSAACLTRLNNNLITCMICLALQSAPEQPRLLAQTAKRHLSLVVVVLLLLLLYMACLYAICPHRTSG